jgi:hypothetical protein
MFPRTVDETEHDKEKAITTTVTMETKRIPIYVHFATQSSVLAIDFVSIFGAEKFFSVLTIYVVSICGTEGFSSVLTLDIVSVFSRERFSSNS